MIYPDLNQPATQADLARLLGVSRAAVHSHHDQGLFTAEASLGTWLQEYINKLRTEAAGRGAEDDDRLREATIRERIAKARKTELDIAVTEKQLVAMYDVYRELQPFVLHVRSTMEAAGNRIATALSAQYGVKIDKRLLENEFRTALSAIADYTAISQHTD